MSFYGNRCHIGGVPCGMVLRGAANGEYRAVFEREFASLEDIEGIQWDRPQIQGECASCPPGTASRCGTSSTARLPGAARWSSR